MSTPAVRTPEEIQAAESHALALDALDAIQRVSTPVEAESLLARVKVAAEAARVMHLGKALSREWRGIEIKAERKWGELLGEAKTGGTGANQHSNVSGADVAPSTGAEREAVREARKVAAVPGPVFEEYVDTTETPSKAGLLRAAADRQPSLDHAAAAAVIADLAQKDPRVQRSRARALFAKAMYAMSTVNVHADAVVDAAIHDDHDYIADIDSVERTMRRLRDALQPQPLRRIK